MSTVHRRPFKLELLLALLLVFVFLYEALPRIFASEAPRSHSSNGVSDIASELLVPPLPPYPEALLPTLEETERIYAEDGIWPRTPERPTIEALNVSNEVFSGSIDPEVLLADPIGLPDPALNPSETLRRIPPPLPFGTVLDHARGLVTPTPQGVLSPEGAFLISGRPPILPVPRSEASMFAAVSTDNFMDPGMGYYRRDLISNFYLFSSPSLGCIALWPLNDFQTYRDDRLVSVNLNPQFLLYSRQEGNTGTLIYHRGFPTTHSSSMAFGGVNLQLETLQGDNNFSFRPNISYRYFQTAASLLSASEFSLVSNSLRGTRLVTRLDAEDFALGLNLLSEMECAGSASGSTPNLHTLGLGAVLNELDIDPETLRSVIVDATLAATAENGLVPIATNITEGAFSRRPAMRPTSRQAGEIDHEDLEWQEIGPALLNELDIDPETLRSVIVDATLAATAENGLVPIATNITEGAFSRRPAMRPTSRQAGEIDHEDLEWQEIGPAFYSIMFPDALFIVGEIESGDADTIEAALLDREIGLVILASPGGVVFDALEIAETIKDLGLATYIPEAASCMSACIYMFLGGQQRLASGEILAHQLRISSTSSDRILVDAREVLTEALTFTRRINELNAPDWLMDIIQTSPELAPLTTDQRMALGHEAHSIVSNYDIGAINSAMEIIAQR